MLSARQQHKLKRLFTLVDLDQSGAVEFTDLEAVMQRTLDATGTAVDSPVALGASVMLRRFWTEFTNVADVDRNGKIDEAEWFACWEAQLDEEMDTLFTDLPPIVRQIQLLVAQALGVHDAHGADLDAYRAFLAPYGPAVQASAAPVFARLDLDGNGQISSDELQQLTAEFFIAAEEAPGDLLFGPLDAD